MPLQFKDLNSDFDIKNVFVILLACFKKTKICIMVSIVKFI